MRPPQITNIRERKSDVPYSPNTPKRAAERESQWTSRNVSDESIFTNLSQREAHIEQDDKRLGSSFEDVGCLQFDIYFPSWCNYNSN